MECTPDRISGIVDTLARMRGDMGLDIQQDFNPFFNAAHGLKLIPLNLQADIEGIFASAGVPLENGTPWTSADTLYSSACRGADSTNLYCDVLASNDDPSCMNCDQVLEVEDLGWKIGRGLIAFNDYDPTGATPDHAKTFFPLATSDAAYEKIYKRIFKTPEFVPEFLGFEGPEGLSGWVVESGPGTLSLDPTVRSQGGNSLMVSGCGFTSIGSKRFNTTDLGVLSHELSVDVFVPRAPGNPAGFWYGALAVTLSLPSANINNQQLRQIELTPLGKDQFVTVKIPIPEETFQALQKDLAGLILGFKLNTPCQQLLGSRRAVRGIMTRLALLSWFLVACGCTKTDRDATPADGDLLLALDGFHRLAIEDACRGGGKGNFCSSERATAIERLTSSDTAVVEVLRREQLPTGLSSSSADFALHALRPGKTQITVDARFDDGSLRHTELTVVAIAPNALDVTLGCGHPDVTDRQLLPMGAKSRVTVTLRRDRQDLGGFALDALQGGSLVPLAGSLERTEYTLTLPSAVGPVKLSSALVSDFALSLQVFGPDEVSIASLDSRLPKPLRFASGAPVALTADLRVAGKAPCFVMPLQASTRSPDICVGPNHETDWSEDTPGSMRILPLASGRCELTVSVLGSKKTADFGVDFEVAP